MSRASGGRISSGGPSATSVDPTLSNGGIFLPFAAEEVGGYAWNATIVGTANVQNATDFVMPYTVTINRVTVNIGTGLAASKMGVCIYSADGLTKLTAADGINTAASGVQVVNLSNVITLTRNVRYWLSWVLTDGTTLTTSNVLQTVSYNQSKNAHIIRNGTSNNVTANGITGATLGVISSVLLRIPLFYFD